MGTWLLTRWWIWSTMRVHPLMLSAYIINTKIFTSKPYLPTGKWRIKQMVHPRTWSINRFNKTTKPGHFYMLPNMNTTFLVQLHNALHSIHYHRFSATSRIHSLDTNPKHDIVVFHKCPTLSRQNDNTNKTVACSRMAADCNLGVLRQSALRPLDSVWLYYYSKLIFYFISRPLKC